IYDAEDLSNVKVDYRGGTPLRLRDVANVIEGFPPPIGDAVISSLRKMPDGERRVGEPGLLLIVEKQPWGNTLSVTRQVEAALDSMVIAGLVIALGEVVDDAIIDVENILRRLQLNRALAHPQSSFQVVLAASLEVRSAVVYASLIVTLVFVPILFLDGLAGSFF